MRMHTLSIAAVALTLPAACLLSGCSAAAKLADLSGARAEARLDTKLSNTQNAIIRDLGEVKDSAIRQVTNDLWPVALMVLGGQGLGAVALLGIVLGSIWMIIKRQLRLAIPKDTTT